MREEERIRLAARVLIVLAVGSRRDQRGDSRAALGLAGDVGVAHQPLRDALGVDAARTAASARVTSSCETPTRKPPVISLFTDKRPRRVELVASTARSASATARSGGRPRSGSRRSSTQTARPRSLRLASAAAAAARWFRPGRRPPGSTRRTATRAGRRASLREQPQQLASARPGAACRRPGSTPPRPRRPARRLRSSAAARRAWRRLDVVASSSRVERGEAASWRGRPRSAARRPRIVVLVAVLGLERPAPRSPCSLSQRTITAT